MHEGFASWLAHAGKSEEALREARRALKIDPRSLPALRLIAEIDSQSDHLFAEALAREKIFRISRSRGDWDGLLRAAGRSTGYARRFVQLRESLAVFLPKSKGS